MHHCTSFPYFRTTLDSWALNTNNGEENYIDFWNFFIYTTTKWHANKGKQKWPKGKARSLIFVRRGKPQGGCFPLAQGPVLWWPLPACLPGPPVSNNVWSREPEIPGKAVLHLPGLVDFWKQNSQVSSGLAPILCSCSGANTTRTAQGTARGTATEPRGEPRHVS